MNSRDLQEFTGEITSLLVKFNIGQFGDHTTRVGIVTYGSNVMVRYNLNDVTSLTALNQQLMLLRSYANSSDYGINVQNALKVSYNLLKNQSSNRIPIIFLVGAAYNSIGFNGAEQIASVIKDNGIKIITLSFDASDSVLPAEFDLLASPGYSYISSQDGLYQSLLFGLTQANCFCPQGKHQLQVYNEAFKNYTVYADCLWAIGNDALPSFVQDYGCSNGIVAAITSQEKFDFISDKVISFDAIGKKQFTIGLHNTENGWKWWGYDKTEYPLGDFPSFSSIVGDIYGYVNNSFGLNWNFLSGGDISKPYLCEFKACDTDNICKYKFLVTKVSN
uniref:VWFA domain-containing protein n=1 Tax=Panagrolaimus davidi TaxID=227884 RepID=A0A914PZK0_9BILA